METKSSSTPLWLDIKTEYIDENIDRVIEYLRDSSTTSAKDAFYTTTVDLMEQRIDLLLREIEETPLYQEPESLEVVEKNLRLLGAFLLIHTSIDQKAYCAMTAFLSRLQMLVPTCTQSLTELALDLFNTCITLEPEDYPFGWSDFMVLEPQVLAHKILTLPRNAQVASGEWWAEKKGTLRILKGHADISTMARKTLGYDGQVPSMEIMDGRIRFMTQRSDKLKKSEEDDLRAMEVFKNDFIHSQKDVSPQQRKLETWTDGENVRVRVIDKHNMKLVLETTDQKHEVIQGTLKEEKGFVYYDTGDFFRALKVGDEFEVTLTDRLNGIFSVSQPFIDYMVDECVLKGDVVRAFVMQITSDRSGRERVTLWTEYGYPVQCYTDDGYYKGQYVEVKVEDFGTGKYHGVIIGDILGEAERFTESMEETKRDYIRGSYRYEDEEAAPVKPEIGCVNEGQLREICRMLVTCQKSFPTAADRYRVLCGTEIICSMMQWPDDARYVGFVGDYLENVVRFVKGDMAALVPMMSDPVFAQAPSVLRRSLIIDILMAYGTDDPGDILSRTMESDDPQLSKLAALVQASNNVHSFLSRAMNNVIKREIIATLSLEDDWESDLDGENGIYLGMESDKQEFKTSFFFPPKNAKEQDQRVTILRGVCAFLNSRTGGTLYLGVDDMGYVKGLDNDLEHLERMNLVGYHGIDGYIRYITDEAKKYYDLSILTHVNISAMYEGKVIAITVTPYDYNIVEINGDAYIRLNNESVVMNDATRRKIMTDRIVTNQDDAKLKTQLMDAINNKRQVILHGYNSSNSGDIRDRHVEPFSFASGHDTVWCYDCDAKMNKVFKVERISNVEILQTTWAYASQHKSLRMDIFRMTGDTPIHVRLQLNMMARNVLLEEYDEAAKALTKTDNTDVWYLDTDVYDIKGVGRFYMGLANAIKIIDAPELEEYVASYTKAYLLK